MITKNQIKFVKQLEQKKHRQREGLFVAEGPKVVGDLLAAGFQPVIAFATEEWSSTLEEAKLQRVSPDELSRISFLQHPQQVLALFPLPRVLLSDECLGLSDERLGLSDESLELRIFSSAPHHSTEVSQLSTEVSQHSTEVSQHSTLNTQQKTLNTQQKTLYILALDGVQDPGNLGTIIRVADWFGIDRIVCSADTADCWSPKVVQATMGSIARVSIVYTDLVDYLQHTTLPVCGTLLNGRDIFKESLPSEAIIVMGNEGNGISQAVRQLVTHPLLIPQYRPGAESLNVAIATAITCAEFRRRATK